MTTAFSHSPRPVGGPASFEIKGDRLIVDSRGKVREVRLDAVAEVRLTCEARSLGHHASQTRIKLKDGKTFSFSSLDWKSMVRAERVDRDYRAFARTLFDAVARANPQARFVAGRPRIIWLATAALGVVSLAAMGVFIWRTLQYGATGAAIMGVALVLAGIWQIEPIVRLNRPRRFTPDEPPSDLMP